MHLVSLDAGLWRAHALWVAPCVMQGLGVIERLSSMQAIQTGQQQRDQCASAAVTSPACTQMPCIVTAEQ